MVSSRTSSSPVGIAVPGWRLPSPSCACGRVRSKVWMFSTWGMIGYICVYFPFEACLQCHAVVSFRSIRRYSHFVGWYPWLWSFIVRRGAQGQKHGSNACEIITEFGRTWMQSVCNDHDSQDKVWRRLDWEQGTVISHHQLTLSPQAGHIDWGGKVLALWVGVDGYNSPIWNDGPTVFFHVGWTMPAGCVEKVDCVEMLTAEHGGWDSRAQGHARQEMIHPARRWRNIAFCKNDHWIQDPLWNFVDVFFFNIISILMCPREDLQPTGSQVIPRNQIRLSKHRVPRSALWFKNVWKWDNVFGKIYMYIYIYIYTRIYTHILYFFKYMNI